MSRLFIDQPVEHVSSLPIVAILGVAPLAVLGIRLDLAIVFSVLAMLVVTLSTSILHLLHELADDHWLTLWAMLIAGFWVSLAELLLRQISPGLLQNLGIYLPLLALSPLVLVQVQLVRRGLGFGQVLGDSLRMMLSFAALLISTAVVREFLGNGSLTLLSLPGQPLRLVVPGLSSYPLTFLVGAAGGLVLIGFILAFRNWIVLRSERVNQGNIETGKGDNA